MIRKIIYTTGSILLAFFVGVALYDVINTSTITSKIYIPSKSNNMYDINIKPTKTGIGTVKVFKPNAAEINIQKASTYAGLFGLKQYSEDNENYYFSDYSTTLTVRKLGGLIQYTANKITSSGAITAEDARNIAERFVKEKNLPLDYTDAQVEFSNESKTYNIKFVNTLENKKNYAFPKTVEVDEGGTVVSLTYYDFTYSAIGEVKGISLQVATDILTETEPVLESSLEGAIDIRNAELVYYLNDDLLYPYYRFTGLLTSGHEFESLVQAYSEL